MKFIVEELSGLTQNYIEDGNINRETLRFTDLMSANEYVQKQYDFYTKVLSGISETSFKRDEKIQTLSAMVFGGDCIWKASVYIL